MAEPRQQSPKGDDDTVREDVEEAMAVDSLPDEVRMHGDTDETERVQRSAGPPEPAPEDDTSSEE